MEESWVDSSRQQQTMPHANGTSHAGSVMFQAVTHLLCAARFDRVRPEVTRRVFRDPSPRHPTERLGIGHWELMLHTFPSQWDSDLTGRQPPQILNPNP